MPLALFHIQWEFVHSDHRPFAEVPVDRCELQRDGRAPKMYQAVQDVAPQCLQSMAGNAGKSMTTKEPNLKLAIIQVSLFSQGD